MARKGASKRPLQNLHPGAPPQLYRFLGSTDSFVYSDERFRPTWEPQAGYRLTAEHRSQLCTHLAAHAAVSSLGGAAVYTVAVAPVGVRSWTHADRKTHELPNIWGMCSTSDWYCNHIYWDSERQIYVADRDAWELFIKDICEHMAHPRMSLKSERHSHDPRTQEPPTVEQLLTGERRIVRAQACGYLAGHIADGICAGMNADEALRLYDRRDTECVGASDIAVAQGLTDLLPPGEYDHAVQITEQVLRRPDIWDVVTRVAAELERFDPTQCGESEDRIYELLPATERDWPPGPGQVTL